MGSPELGQCAFAVVDVETTGSRASGGDRIIEIAVVAVIGGTAELAYHSLVDPGRPLPVVTTSLTRITSDMVRGQPAFADIADDVIASLAGRVFVAHNVRFDWRFVGWELRAARDLVLDGPRLCTVELARRLVPGLRSRGLDSLTAYFGVEIAQRHRAADDALATARILLRLLDLARERGAETLDDLRRLTKKKRRRKRSALPRSMDEL
jgi:DNA polymerase-3 subunit epsilon